MDSFLASVPLWAIFFSIAVALLALEMLSLTFDLLWLGLAALSGALIAWLVPSAPAWVPTLASIGVALVLLYFGRRWAKKQRGINHYVSEADALVGREAEVIRAIRPPQLGLIRSGNETWSATAAHTLELGQRVVIKSRSATVVTVEMRAEG
jgi:inner membrane protein